jgi:hypothetical protein
MAAKVATVIVNETGQGLTMKVGSRDCFVRIASVEEGGEYTMRHCVDWTYQEFVLEDPSDPGRKLFVNSDDCCDYERITVKECAGVLSAETVPRHEIWDTGGCQLAVAEHTATAAKREKFSWRCWR